MKKPGKRGRKPAKIDLKAKLERSRQSARECRARKKLRYQYLEELVSSKERAICALREELEMVNTHTHTHTSRHHSVICPPVRADLMKNCDTSRQQRTEEHKQ